MALKDLLKIPYKILSHEIWSVEMFHRNRERSFDAVRPGTSENLVYTLEERWFNVPALINKRPDMFLVRTFARNITRTLY